MPEKQNGPSASQRVPNESSCARARDSQNKISRVLFHRGTVVSSDKTNKSVARCISDTIFLFANNNARARPRSRSYRPRNIVGDLRASPVKKDERVIGNYQSVRPLSPRDFDLDFKGLSRGQERGECREGHNAGESQVSETANEQMFVPR